MDSERWGRIQSVFLAALDHEAVGRSAFLDQACAGDVELRREIDAMLNANDDERALAIERRLVVDQPPELPDPQALLETRIGPYRLKKLIGRGGMGDVYLAERDDDQYKQQVALKLVGAGLHTADIVRRFRAERQILAQLVHPNIARLADGGVTRDGKPYLVMEYVVGVPITKYCNSQHLTIEQRLGLFRTVCASVDFAHRNLIVHRDIKPSNILVTDQGEVKLLDFGIAKLLDPDAAEVSVALTRTEVRMMTPEYAAPEQIRGTPITTATDVYSLGILLYELLTGHRPYRLQGRGQADIERIICDNEPTRPSSVVVETAMIPRSDGSTDTLTPEQVCAERGTQQGRLQRRLRGDLDNIVMMALRKEPERRYASAGQFAEDIERHLGALPVRARRDTLGYRVKKFVSRHSGFVTAGAAIALVVVGFAITSTAQARRIALERDRAEQERAATADVLSVLTGLFERANPKLVPGGDTVRVVTLLEEAESKIEQLNEQPDRQAAVLRAVGNMQVARGQYDRGAELLRRSYEQQVDIRGTDDLEAARTYHDLALAVHAHEGDDAARPMFDTAVTTFRRLVGEVTSDTRKALQSLAVATIDPDEKRELLTQVVNIERQLPDVDSIDIAGRLNAEGGEQHNRGRPVEAAALFRASLDILEAQRGPDDQARLTVTNNLAVSLTGAARWSEAEPLQREIIEEADRVDASAGVRGGYREQLGVNLAQQGRLEEAESLVREGLALMRESFAEEHSRISNARRNLALIVVGRGRTEEGLAMLDSAIAQITALGPEAHWRAHYQMGQRVPMLLELGRVSEAAQSAATAASSVRNSTVQGHRWRGDTVRWVGMVAFAEGRYEVALGHFRAADEMLRQALPAGHPRLATVACLLGVGLEATDKPAEALRYLREACPRHDARGLSDTLVSAWGRTALQRAERARRES